MFCLCDIRGGRCLRRRLALVRRPRAERSERNSFELIERLWMWPNNRAMHPWWESSNASTHAPSVNDESQRSYCVDRWRTCYYIYFFNYNTKKIILKAFKSVYCVLILLLKLKIKTSMSSNCHLNISSEISIFWGPNFMFGYFSLMAKKRTWSLPLKWNY